jgi:hypothetical protein
MGPEQISRRRMLKRIGAGAAVAWSAPVLTSLSIPASAHAVYDQCNQCAGDFCFGQTPCGGDVDCLCAQIVGAETSCFCYRGAFTTTCATLPKCADGCPAGTTCVHTCCDAAFGTVCLPGCSGAAPEAPHDAEGGLTPGGREI